MWSPLVRRDIFLSTFYGIYFSHHYTQVPHYITLHYSKKDKVHEVHEVYEVDNINKKQYGVYLESHLESHF